MYQLSVLLAQSSGRKYIEKPLSPSTTVSLVLKYQAFVISQ